MGVIAQYQVSAANPSIVGGTGGGIKYFSSNPPQSLWNSGATGVNSPQNSAQLGNTPSSSSALGQLSFDTVAYKLNGSRFSMYASGTAISGTTSTIAPIVQYNSGTVASPSYSTLMGGTASNALVASVGIGWSMWGDFYFDPSSATLGGTWNLQYQNGSGGGTDSHSLGNILTTVTGVTAGGIYATQFGFVVGVTFGTSNASNSASLFQFQVNQW
jgi:hypothetical protein